MRRSFSAALAAVFTLCLTHIDAAAVPNGVVKFDMRHKHLPKTPSAREHLRRDATINRHLRLNNHWVPQGGYFIDVSVGTPPQNLEVLLDTGSSNLFLPSANAPRCVTYTCPGGAFSTAGSSTYSVVREGTNFSMEYIDGSRVLGTYSKDLVTLGSAALPNFVFGVAEHVQVSPGWHNGPQYGIMGVSFADQEPSACLSVFGKCPVTFTIPTIPDALYAAGYIRSRSYSLYLDDVTSDRGSILFGGIDTSKFTGNLIELAVQKQTNPDYYGYGHYIGQNLRLTSMATVVGGRTTQLTSSNYSSTVTLDSGADGLFLPSPLYRAVTSTLPLSFAHQSHIFCSDAGLDAHLAIVLEGAEGRTAKLKIPMSNLVVPVYRGSFNSTEPYRTADGRDICALSVNAGSATEFLLGDPFLRSAYVFYNLDQKTISLAQARYNDGSSRVVAVGAGPAPSLAGTADS